MIVYIYGKCSTCKNALKFLEKTKELKPYTVKEITQEAPSMEELQKMLEFQKGNLKKLFNTSGQLYRELQLNKKLNDMPLKEALKLLSQYGMLVKRPFVIDENFGLTGFKENEWTSLLV